MMTWMEPERILLVKPFPSSLYSLHLYTTKPIPDSRQRFEVKDFSPCAGFCLFMVYGEWGPFLVMRTKTQGHLMEGGLLT